jgi:hypothetical protein
MLALKTRKELKRLFVIENENELMERSRFIAVFFHFVRAILDLGYFKQIGQSY